ncbi:uncharacterized protein LOC124686185 [Lolium rigidum]|uniref:uncharacterized protein LOC124686185 n=1 Tax=Lolium rigidum TaxID=89674 RepID=UPI001F5E2F90|nr:uncharacterized protein LOC124686185 [Lolium rigidum]
MLCLRSSILISHLLSSAASPIYHLHRLVSAAAHPLPPNPMTFAFQEYLVDRCGLTQAQALKASTKLSHLKSPAKPDAVLAFLAGLGLSSADVAALVARDPRFLCTGVDKILAPNVAGLMALGLSRSEVARLVPLATPKFRCRSIVSKLHYYLPLFGSAENLLRVLKYSDYLLDGDLDRMVKPNVAFLRECGIDAVGISKLCLTAPRILGTKPEHIRAMAALAEAIGVPCGSGMFRLALQAVAFSSQEKIAVRVECLKNTFGWSDAEVGIAVCKFPMLLKMSKDNLQSKSEFLLSEVELEPAYIAHRPSMLGLSLEGRLRPRYYIVKYLKENGLVKCNRDYYSTLIFSEKAFVDKFICPHKEAAPYLSGDYAAACRGEIPTRYRSS